MYSYSSYFWPLSSEVDKEEKGGREREREGGFVGGDRMARIYSVFCDPGG